MNTVEKGTAFENKTADRFSALMEAGLFIVTKENAKLYKQKKYYSRDRDNDIIFDIAIECFRPGATDPTLYILIECKDYSSTVPVSDVEEFFTKATQVKGLNMKCMFVATAPYQESALTFAKSKCITLIRIQEDDSMQWLIERAPNHLEATSQAAAASNVLNAMLDPYFINSIADMYILDYNKPYTDVRVFIYDLLNGVIPVYK